MTYPYYVVRSNQSGIYSRVTKCDSDFRGECGAILINLSKDVFTVQPGMRICQFVVSPVPRVELERVTELSDTKRGSGGFGSTGLN